MGELFLKFKVSMPVYDDVRKYSFSRRRQAKLIRSHGRAASRCLDYMTVGGSCLLLIIGFSS